MNTPRKYGILRLIALILKGLAWIVLLLGIAGTVALFGVGGALSANAPEILRTVMSAGALALPFATVIGFVQLFAFGSILSLLIDIEQNTRNLTAELGRKAW